MTLAGAPIGGAAIGRAAYGGATMARVVSDTARATDSVTVVVRTEMAAALAVVESAAADMRELTALQRAVIDAMNELTGALRDHQRRQPRWWESPTFVTGMTVLGVLITLASFIGDRVDAAREDPARTEPPPVSGPAVPGQGGPVDEPATR